MAPTDRQPDRHEGPGRKRRGLGLEGASTLVQTLAILGAGAWGVYTFVYEARIKPGLAPPSVSVKTDLARVGEHGDRVAIRSTVTRTNVGQAGVRVLGLTYTVVGIRTRFSEPGDDTAAREAAFRASLSGTANVDAARDYVRESGGTPILRQGLLFSGATPLPSEPSDLNPGESVSRDVIVYVDRKTFDAVRFEVRLAYAKEDDPPVRLRFEAGADGVLATVPAEPCPAPKCPLRTTDFATEFSLW
ncbi:UNVERIFIED_ORG: hypothetical protein M2438_002578 [Methylobacterium sp. SuP10 SLI 274]|uniref:hypothetical protein n=1 Tax=Methylorubrum extorquens TaxID=408 RepID=UPI0020A18C9C|nr:hypothetical protein [Methylorubrum extorquens]MDF9863804.1 hypothetical protein [Methylorubrum pseudosasae]MDH6637403.1 hypothetical protein [Methylobacterium sp. SuP10 SLI 274]MDH6666583.1 hypothetical protein [Methylorubrum zatmanii]MCP1558493.1 hypothetical protein [Methylorubrum extorquens]MDF9792121.1 hypothetical protein [Methylorubrum extorquens]